MVGGLFHLEEEDLYGSWSELSAKGSHKSTIGALNPAQSLLVS